MSNFKEFLEDYEAQEKEESEKYIKRLREGKVPYDEIYPSPNRFVKLKQPIAFSTTNIWGEIPFYGSTIIHLVPCHDKESFDEVHNYHGFTSRHIDKMIDFAKETGRIQYLIDNPTYYKNNEFLEPLFHELRPPSPMPIPELFISDTYKKYLIEFDTLAKINFNDFIKGLELFNTITIANNRLGKYAFIYIALKTIGYVELADEIGYLMISNPTEAIRYLQIFADFIVAPHCDTLKSIYNFNREFFTEVHGVGKQHGIDIEKNIPYEIGKFLLNKLVLYPETYEGCMKVIQEYDDYEMHTVLSEM